MSKVVHLNVEPSRAGAPDERGAPAENPALVRDGLDIMMAFQSIADEEVRRSLVTLTRALAGRSAS